MRNPAGRQELAVGVAQVAQGDDVAVALVVVARRGGSAGCGRRRWRRWRRARSRSGAARAVAASMTTTAWFVPGVARHVGARHEPGACTRPSLSRPGTRAMIVMPGLKPSLRFHCGRVDVHARAVRRHRAAREVHAPAGVGRLVGDREVVVGERRKALLAVQDVVTFGRGGFGGGRHRGEQAQQSGRRESGEMHPRDYETGVKWRSNDSPATRLFTRASVIRYVPSGSSPSIDAVACTGSGARRSACSAARRSRRMTTR